MRRIERRYADAVQVVSVHSPKFPTERETKNLRQAVLRLRIEHPVLNDADFKFWQQYGARAWPTIFFVDPRGNVIGLHEGELTEEMAAPLIDGWLSEYEAESLLTRQPLELTRETGADSALSFPRQGRLRRREWAPGRFGLEQRPDSARRSRWQRLAGHRRRG